ncbi:VOC family protein [Marinibaculum pumilum]|uniref:VOC family protein n=1 Tax=Marinibaculum pumilum TaxID=1766165 RepID=A0ABV7LAA0_9PROT
MLNHVSIGVADIARARDLYDAALAPLGYRCLDSGEAHLGYGADAIGLWLLKEEGVSPGDPRPGLHLCFEAPDRSAVAAFHEAALARGGRDNGAPGLRPDYGADYFAGFVIDPDGYRIEAYCGG